jgi:N4-gp56 family major capsid protein
MADMNVTPSRPGLTPIIWQSDFWVEYLRENQFSVYFGTTMDAMIQLQTDLTRKRGDTVVFPTVRNLVGAGVTGNTVLEGNEEILNARSLNVTVGVIRHAVAVSEWDEQKSIIDLLQAGRQVLKNWAANKLRADIITSLGAITADGNVQITYAAATAAQRNTWLVNNSDRVLFGASKSNNTGVYATSLTNVDNTADKLTAAQVTLAKRIARTATPKIRPIRVSRDEEWYVMFVPSMAFRDLMLDPVIINALQYAWNRGSDNPLFTAGDILYDGVIIREIPELPVLAGAGSGGTTDVAASYLCGAQAIGIAWAQRTKVIENRRDYGFFNGVGVEEIRGVQKLRFGVDPTVDTTKPVDNGVVTVWSAAVADA